MTSEIRANTLKNRVGLGTVSFTNTGPVVSGIVTIANSTSEGVRLEDNAGVGGSLKITTPSGYVSIGAGNAAFVHLNTDRGSYYFQKRIIVDEGIIGSYDDNLTLQSPLNTNRVTINKDTGLVSILNDLDVDGHTNLDNVNITGVTTSSNKVQVNSLGIGIVPIDHQHIHIESANPRILIRSTGTNAAKILFGDNSSNDSGVIEYAHSSDTMKFNTGNLERLRIKSNGALIKGNSGTQVSLGNGANTQLIGTAGADASLALVRQSQGGGEFYFAAGSSGTNIANNNGLGFIKFMGYHTNGYDEYARIQAYVDGTNGDGDAPGRLSFRTTPDNSAISVERLRIGSDGNITQTIDSDGDGFIITAGDMKPMLTGNSNRSAHNNTIFGIVGKWNNTEVGRIAFEAGDDTNNKDNGKIRFYTTPSGGSLTKRLEIVDDGKITVAANSDIRFTNGTWTGEVAGKIQHNSNNLYIQGGTGGIRFRHASSGVNQFSMTNGGNFEITNGDLVVASGHGIDFSAQTHPTAASGVTVNAELLDNYEEGTFQPILKRLMANNVTETNFYNQGTRQGNYTRVGNRVWITGRIHWNGGSTGSGSLLLTNLPYTPTSGGANEVPIVVGYRSGFNYANITGYLVQSTNRFMIQFFDSNGSYNISPGATASSGTFYFAMNYQV